MCTGCTCSASGRAPLCYTVSGSKSQSVKKKPSFQKIFEFDAGHFDNSIFNCTRINNTLFKPAGYRSFLKRASTEIIGKIEDERSTKHESSMKKHGMHNTNSPTIST